MVGAQGNALCAEPDTWMEGEVAGKDEVFQTLLSGWTFCCECARILGKGQTRQSVLGGSFQWGTSRSVALDQPQPPLGP